MVRDMSTAPDSPRSNPQFVSGTFTTDSQFPGGVTNAGRAPGSPTGSPSTEGGSSQRIEGSVSPLRSSLGQTQSAPKSPTFDFQILPDHNLLVIYSGLNEAAWGDVVSVGTAILERLEHSRTSKLLVDLSQLDYMGSSQVALLVRIWKVLKARDGQMAVQVTSEIVHKVLTIAGLHTLWDIVPTRAAAQRALGVRVTQDTAPRAAFAGFPSGAGGVPAADQSVTPILIALGVLFAAFIVLVLGQARVWTGAMEVRLGALMVLSGLAVMCGVWAATRITGPLRAIGLGVCLAGFVMGITAALEWPRTPVGNQLSRPTGRSSRETLPAGNSGRGVAPVSIRASRDD